MAPWLWHLIGFLLVIPCVLPAPFLIAFLRKRRLRLVAATDLPPGPPLVSVIITARDEEPTIERCLRSVLTTDYPSIEVIAVNDRSQDRTGSIVDELASTDPRLVAVHIDELPSGWLGKNHALARAAERARGEFLLFADGDVIMDPQVMSRAMAHTIAQQLDHLTLLPGMIAKGFWERATLTLFSYCGFSLIRAWNVRHRRSRAFAGVGAFNLVRTSAYQERGGHDSLRYEVVDDVMLGRLMKTGGGNSDVLSAFNDLQIRWQPGALGIVRGLEKNAFAALGYSVVLSLGATISLGLATIGPWLAIAWLHDTRALGIAIALLLFHGAFAIVARLVGFPATTALGLTGAALLMMLTVVRSMFRTLQRGGVRWRETFYPLADLRRERRALTERFRRASVGDR